MIGVEHIAGQDTIPVIDHPLDQHLDTDFNIFSSIELKSHVDVFYRLKDPVTRDRFTQFHEAQSSPYPLFVSFLGLIALIGHSFLLHLDIYSTDISIRQWIPVDVIAIFIVIITAILGIAVTYLETEIKRKTLNKEEVDNERYWKRWITYAFFTGLGIYGNIYAIRRSLGIVCDHDIGDSNFISEGGNMIQMRENQRVVSSIFCGYDKSDDGVPIEVVVASFTLPVAMIVSSPSISIYFIWSQVCVFMTNLSILWSLNQQIPSLYLLLVWLMGTVFVIAKIQCKNVRTYLFIAKLREMLRDNERLAEEFHISEMRYVIANMAHDLKTPLTSFITGMDLIKQTVQESERQLNPSNNSGGGGKESEEVDINTIKSCLSSIKQCVNNITDTNSFMLMTINRCIDYAKAAKGIKLVPRPETIDLWETMQLPAICLRNVQDRVQIVLSELSIDICTHVITDKQWLQENLLCLLSNAVKYTTKGSVTLSVTLIDTKNPYGSSHAVVQSREEGISTRDSTNGTRGTMSSVRRGEGNAIAEAVAAMRAGLPSPPGLALSSPPDTVTVNTANHTFPQSLPTPPPVGSMSIDVMDVAVTVGGNTVGLGSTGRGSSTESNYVMAAGISSRSDIGEIAGVTANSNNNNSTRKMTGITKYLLFEVEDNGIGVPSDARETLFRPFRQTQRLAGGTGLGLYSLAKRVEGIHGEYGVRNRKDGLKGSLFWFTVPYRPDEATAMLKARRPRSNSSYSTTTTETADEMTTAATNVNKTIGNNNNNAFRSSLPGFVSNLTLHVDGHIMSEAVTPRPGLIQAMNNPSLPQLDVLIVDDSLSILKMTSMMLRKLGHTITTAENGEIAVNTIEERWKLKHESFDVILMDLQMPVMDGLEATKRIRLLENETTRNVSELIDEHDDIDEFFPIPRQLIIGVSANSDYETSDVALTAGVDAFIAKPFTVDTFQKTVMNCLFRR